MTSHHILFTRPLALRFTGQPALQIVGQLDAYVAGQAYEGRLQIINNIGDCTVEWVSGTMPAGTTIRVDNATHEVVVAWPSYQPADPNTTVVPNGSFEEGDVKWEKGGGWAIETGGGNDTFDGAWSAVYRGRGIASLTSVMVPVVVGTSITASVQIQQGASSAGNVTARVVLVWMDAYGKTLSFDGGNIVRSGSNGAWHASTVTAKAPAGAFNVAFAISANRKRQNKRLWADKATWNHSYPSGQNTDDDYCIVLRVRDSAGRTATWEGCVGERAIYLTTQPYPYYDVDSISAQMPGVSSVRMSVPPSEVDYMGAIMAAIAGDLRVAEAPSIVFQPEAVASFMAASSGSLREVQRSYDMGVEGFASSMAPTGATLKNVLITYDIGAESIRTMMSPNSGTLA